MQYGHFLISEEAVVVNNYQVIDGQEINHHAPQIAVNYTRKTSDNLHY